MLFIGNLDCDIELSGRSHETLPPRVLANISALAGLMVALAPPDAARPHVVWTPAPVDRARWVWPRGPDGLPDAAPATGPLETLAASVGVDAAGREVVPWCRTASFVRAFPGIDGPSPAIVATVNHRRFGHALESALGSPLASARFVDGLDDLAHAIANWPDDRSWVVKAPQSSSARLRLRRRGPALDPPSRARLARLFDRFDALLFEPWLDRILDIGCVGRVAADGVVTVAAPHAIDTDDIGVVRGIALSPTALTDAHRDQVTETATRVGHALFAAGYWGPFGIDAFTYRDAVDGGERLRPLVEINARHTFGSIAHAAAARLARGRPFRLHLGGGERGAELIAPGTARWTA